MDAVSMAAAVANRANQLNPYHWVYWSSRGYDMASAVAAASAAGAAAAGSVAATTAGAASTGIAATIIAALSQLMGIVGTAYTIYSIGSWAYLWFIGH